MSKGLYGLKLSPHLRFGLSEKCVIKRIKSPAVATFFATGTFLPHFCDSYCVYTLLGLLELVGGGDQNRTDE